MRRPGVERAENSILAHFFTGWLLASYSNFLILYDLIFKMAIKMKPPSSLGLERGLHERELWKFTCCENVHRWEAYPLRCCSTFQLERCLSKASCLTCFVSFYFPAMRLWIWGQKGSGDVSMNVHSSIICNSKKSGSNPNVHQWMNGKTNCHIFLQWNII